MIKYFVAMYGWHLRFRVYFAHDERERKSKSLKYSVSGIRHTIHGHTKL